MSEKQRKVNIPKVGEDESIFILCIQKRQRSRPFGICWALAGALSQEESTYTLHAISKNVTQERELAGDPLQLSISIQKRILVTVLEEKKMTIIAQTDNRVSDQEKAGSESYPTHKRHVALFTAQTN